MLTILVKLFLNLCLDVATKLVTSFNWVTKYHTSCTIIFIATCDTKLVFY
jgi:hypothetical protein